MRSFALATGSSGNCFYIESKEGVKVLVDLGLPFAKIDEVLSSYGVDVKEINAVFITHEHSDHIVGLKTFAKRVDCPIFLTKGTFEEVSKMKVSEKSKQFNIVKHHNNFVVGDLKVFVLNKPHDAKEAVSFIFNDGETKLGVFTDLGHITDETKHVLKTLDVIYFEANYCERHIKDNGNSLSHTYLNRLMSDVGHLSLSECCNVLGEVCSNTQKIILSHISENTNSYENVYLQVKDYLEGLEKFPEVLVGFQGEPTDWIE